MLSEEQRERLEAAYEEAMCGWDRARVWLKTHGDDGASMPRDILESGLSDLYEIAERALAEIAELRAENGRLARKAEQAEAIVRELSAGLPRNEPIHLSSLETKKG